MMNLTAKNIFWLFLLFSKFGVSSAQCPTTGLPTTSVKGKFDITYGTTKTLVDGTPTTKITMCPSTPFTIADKSGLTGIQYYFNTSRTAFPAPPAGYSTVTNPTVNVPAAAAQYIIIQISYDVATRAVKSYACQALDVKAPTVLPVFSASSCAASQAQIDIPTNANNTFDSYLVNWGDGVVETVLKAQIPLIAKKHTYPNINSRTIIVTGKKSTEQCDATALAPITPSGKSTNSPTMFSLTVQDADTVQVRYIGGNYLFDFYQKWNTDSYRKVKSVQSPPIGLNVVKIPVKDANKEQYCYKVGISDACSRTTYSDSSCTIPLQVSVLDKRNVLKWKPTTYPKFVSYRVVKNGNANFKTITKATTDTLTDRPTVCGTTYSYQIIALTNAIQSLSQTINVLGVDSTKPPVITNILASVEKDKVAVTVTLPAGQRLKSYNFYHLKNNKLEAFNTGGNGTRAVDENSAPSNQRECYKVDYINTCGIKSDTSAAFCPSFLTLDGAGIKWTEYQKFVAGLNSYYVEKLDDKGTVLTTTKVNKDLKLTIDPSTIDPTNPIVKYRVRALSTNNVVSYSNEILYAQKLMMFMPDAFTPNGDNMNETFEIKGIFIKDFTMRIYNRSGNVVFETEDYKKGWDGTYNENAVPEGQYYYEINATDFKGEITKANGRIFVVR